MALSRARCAACTLPLGDPPFATIFARCVRCGVAAPVSIAADGQAEGFDAGFIPQRLSSWFAAARVAMARGGHLGIAVGACARCSSPLVIPSTEAITIPCPHCREPVRGPAAAVLVDLWSEAWAKAAAGDTDLEYRLEVVDAADRQSAGQLGGQSVGQSAGCAACGNPTPAEDPSPVCRRCGAVAWIERPAAAPGAPPRRVQLGVRVNGVRAKLPYKALVPIVQGEAMLRTDTQRTGAARGGDMLLGSMGVGCAIAAGGGALLVLLVVLLVHYLGK